MLQEFEADSDYGSRIWRNRLEISAGARGEKRLDSCVHNLKTKRQMSSAFIIRVLVIILH